MMITQATSKLLCEQAAADAGAKIFDSVERLTAARMCRVQNEIAKVAIKELLDSIREMRKGYE